MKISEAMRKGAKMGPQLFNKNNDGYGGSCAMGAVQLGIAPGILECSDAWEPLKGLRSCPFDNCSAPFTNGTDYFGSPHVMAWSPRNVGQVIVHLNNDHRWTRERIAGWIEANVEVPTYSMLEMQEFMGEPVMDEVKAEVRR